MKDEEHASMSKKPGGSNFLVTIYREDGHECFGVVQWLDSGKKLHFRSTLEMLTLLNEAVMIQTEGNKTCRSWREVKGIRAI